MGQTTLSAPAPEVPEAGSSVSPLDELRAGCSFKELADRVWVIEDTLAAMAAFACRPAGGVMTRSDLAEYVRPTLVLPTEEEKIDATIIEHARLRAELLKRPLDDETRQLVLEMGSRADEVFGWV
jgi:hypothetical protein